MTTNKLEQTKLSLSVIISDCLTQPSEYHNLIIELHSPASPIISKMVTNKAGLCLTNTASPNASPVHTQMQSATFQGHKRGKIKLYDYLILNIML